VPKRIGIYSKTSAKDMCKILNNTFYFGLLGSNYTRKDVKGRMFADLPFELKTKWKVLICIVVAVVGLELITGSIISGTWNFICEILGYLFICITNDEKHPVNDDLLPPE
jgi:hypothetical protein